MIAGLGALSVPERRRRRRLLALAEGLDEQGRAIWGPVADRITEYEARIGDPSRTPCGSTSPGSGMP
ncbi:hypothetical protein [Streptomyces sp. NBC_00073]|uniref:hypothetical protein n=1 Tax=Streptomyces sp. NBC_00073 TaxID=2975640 RepID=UPI002F90E5A5